MKLFLGFRSLLLVLFAVLSATFAQTNRPLSLSTRPAPVSERKIDMSRVKMLLDKAAEEGKRGNDVEQGKYLTELAEMARQAWDLQDVTTSETVFRQILTVKSDYPDALFGLAELYRRTNPVWATEFYTKYLQVDPGNAGAYYGRGSCYLGREAYTLAIEDLKYLVEQLAPNHVAGLTNLALAYRGRAMERNKDPELFKQAVEYMKRAVQAAEMTNDQESQSMLPELRYRLGRLVFEYDGILAAAQGQTDFKDAINYLMQAIQSAYQAAGREPDNSKLLDQIIYAMDALSEVYSAQAQMNPKDPEPYVQLARIVMKKMEIQVRQSQVLALDFYRKAVRVNPNVAENWFNMGWTCDQLGATKAALEAVDKAISLAPNNADYKKVRERLVTRLKAESTGARPGGIPGAAPSAVPGKK